MLHRPSYYIYIFFLYIKGERKGHSSSISSFDYPVVRSRVDGPAKLTAPASLSISVTQREASRRSPSPPSPAIISPVGAFTISPAKRHRPLFPTSRAMPQVPISVAVATTWRSVPPSLPLLKRTPPLANVVVASCHAGDPNWHREASSCIPLRWRSRRHRRCRSCSLEAWLLQRIVTKQKRSVRLLRRTPRRNSHLHLLDVCQHQSKVPCNT